MSVDTLARELSSLSPEQLQKVAENFVTFAGTNKASILEFSLNVAMIEANVDAHNSNSIETV